MGLLLAFPSVARCESLALSAGASLAGDDLHYRWDRYELGLRRETDTTGQRLLLRFHTYSLDEELAGVLPFEGNEPAVELGGHVLLGDVWWLGAAAGLQGSADLEGAVGELIAARAFATSGAGTFTPRLELAREPLAGTALPLSLGLTSYRGVAALAWRATGWTAEGGVRGELSEHDTVPGRARNPERDEIDATRVITIYGYTLTDSEHWFDAGLSARAAWSSHNTLLATQLSPRAYTWYPASAPPFLWETALILRAGGAVLPSLDAALQLQVPALSQETRQWETLRRTYWGTAPLEAKLEASWRMFSATTLRFQAQLFAEPWERWEVFGAQAYHMVSLHLSLEQRI
jgi:hypothetical protein